MVWLSKHIFDEMDGRGISLHFIVLTLQAADWVTPDPIQPTLMRSFKVIAEFGNRVLRVVHRADGLDVFVVTAHWDRGAKPR